MKNHKYGYVEKFTTLSRFYKVNFSSFITQRVLRW